MTSTPATAASPSLSTVPKARSGWLDALHLVTCCSFAIAQPMYDRLGEQGVFLIDQNIRPVAIYLICGVLSVGFPVLLLGLLWLGRLCHHRLYELGYRGLLWGLLVLLWLPVSKLLPFFPGPLLLLLAGGASVLSVWSYLRWPVVRTIVSWASIGIILFPLLFLMQSPALRQLVAATANVSARWQPTPVVMIVFDEFCGASLQTPARLIDSDRFPNFAALAQSGTWFRHATTVSPDTPQALPAILSGRYPRVNMIPSNRDLPQNLFLSLESTGRYDLAAFEPVSSLAPHQAAAEAEARADIVGRTCFLADILWRVYLYHVLPQAYHRQLPEIPLVWFGLLELQSLDQSQPRGVFKYPWGTQRDQQFEHFLRTLDGSERPAVHFLHVLLPHLPWSFEPKGRRYAPDGEDWSLLEIRPILEQPGAWAQDELLVARHQQRYLLQLMYVDQLLGRLVHRLKETGMYDRCLLVIMADHGISFRSGVPRRKFVPANEEEILSIPLFIKRPGQTTGATDDRLVESIDVFPTICDVLGLELQSPVDGRNLFLPEVTPRTRTLLKTALEEFQVDSQVITQSTVPETLWQRFGAGTDPRSLYRIGPQQELVGQPLANSTIKRLAAPVQLELTNAIDTWRSDPDSPVPAFFAGRVVTPVGHQQPVILAVAVNGTIQGVTRTYLDADIRDHWELMIPPEVFLPARNEVTYYSVSMTAGQPVLSPCLVVPAVPSPKAQPD